MYTTALRPSYLDTRLFAIPITKQWCIFCGEKVLRQYKRVVKCSDCWNVMCVQCLQQRLQPNKLVECCTSTDKTLCLC